ncbi:hypothetical protein E3N88_32441 [Mikania micrantha]|uniref:Uncharacterized protein n=1 Tax=Mikania micrantha TaxID=192012 RepID=A0A5N6M9S2_9ASTR|nr:hypothetical protein E3N88_32441 [Mikania micrantha]
MFSSLSFRDLHRNKIPSPFVCLGSRRGSQQAKDRSLEDQIDSKFYSHISYSKHVLLKKNLELSSLGSWEDYERINMSNPFNPILESPSLLLAALDQIIKQQQVLSLKGNSGSAHTTGRLQQTTLGFQLNLEELPSTLLVLRFDRLWPRATTSLLSPSTYGGGEEVEQTLTTARRNPRVRSVGRRVLVDRRRVLVDRHGREQ